MKIHTNLDYIAFHRLTRDSGAPITFHLIDQVGSRTHAYGYNVTLEGTGGRNNTGMYGAGDYDGATWDEWGAFFGALYAADENARCGGTVTNPVYANAAHYHYLTDERFREGPTGYLPEDAHARHNWKYEGDVHYGSTQKCSKCSAVRPPFVSGRDWS